MSALRTAVRTTLNEPRFLALAAALAVGETAVRIALALVGPPVLALLHPPVIAVVGFGAAAPIVRRAVDSEVADASWPPLPTLVAAAVLGHAAALPGGVAAFVLVDTPVSAALYWAGHDPSPVALVLSAVVGVAVGVAVAWTVPAAVVARIVAGDGPRRAVGAALARPVASGRGFAVAVGLHLAAAVTVLGAVAVGVATAGPRGSPALAAVAAGGLVALVAPFCLAALAAFHLDRARSDDSGSRPAPARLALVALLLSGMVVGAGAVRVAELRPVDDAPAALPDDPDGVYATALDNTRRTDHRHRAAVDPGPEAFVIEHRVDRTDRQYRQLPRGKAAGESVYSDTGTGSPPIRGFGPVALGSRTVGAEGRTVRASPDYLRWVAEYDEAGRSGLRLPSPGIEGWTVVDRSGDRAVLELREPEAVFAATGATDPDRLTNVTAARVRAVIDRDRRTVDRIEVRFVATVAVDGSSNRVDAHVVHEFAVGVDVTRPAELGPPAPGEAVWQLLVY